MNSIKEFIELTLEVYQERKDYFYYKVIAFLFMISITVLSIVFSINANIIKEYNGYTWYNPFAILRFVNSQIQISEEPKVISLRNIIPSEKPPSNYRFLFVVDRTGSTKLSSDIEKYTTPIKQEVINVIADLVKLDEKELSELTLQELLCLKMNLSFCKGDNVSNEYFINSAVLFYDGEESNEGIFLPLWNNEKDKLYIKNLEFGKKLNPAVFYSNLKSKFVDNKSKGKRPRAIKDRSNFHEFFKEINSKYFWGENPDSTIITIFSDFHHDLNDEEGILKNVPFEKVEKAIKNLASNEKVVQINLVRIPKYDSSSKDDHEIKRLLGKIKQYFTNTYYYHVNTEILVEEASINQRIEEIITPTILDTTNRLVFYFPYTDHKLGIRKETKARVQIHCSEEKNNQMCLISLHSSERINENENTSLVIGVPDEVIKEKYNYEVLKIGDHFHTTIHEDDILEASFLNSSNVSQYSDLSLDIYPYGSTRKYRVPIIFKERLSKLNAELLGVSTLTLLFSIIYFLFFLLADTLINTKDRKDYKSFEVKCSWLVLIFTFGLIYFLINSYKYIDMKSLFPQFLMVLFSVFIFYFYNPNPKNDNLNSINKRMKKIDESLCAIVENLPSDQLKKKEGVVDVKNQIPLGGEPPANV